MSSGTGGILAAPLLPFSAAKSLGTLVVATVLAAMGLALAFMILTLYFLHLVLHGPPRGAGVVSVYIPLGPVGQGGYAILLLGAGYNAILPLQHGDSTLLRAEIVGQVIGVAALGVALVLWAVGTMWLVYGLMATADVLWNDHVHFKQAFWSLGFPNVSLSSCLAPHGHPHPSESNTILSRRSCARLADADVRTTVIL